jgi:hypothetical protein
VNPWMRLSLNAFQLAIEAQSVIALRLMKMAAGDAAALAESQLMVTEKAEAALIANAHLAVGMMTGSGLSGAPKAQAHYRRAVRANRRRLARA